MGSWNPSELLSKLTLTFLVLWPWTVCLSPLRRNYPGTENHWGVLLYWCLLSINVISITLFVNGINRNLLCKSLPRGLTHQLDLYVQLHFKLKNLHPFMRIPCEAASLCLDCTRTSVQKSNFCFQMRSIENSRTFWLLWSMISFLPTRETTLETGPA